MGNVPPSNDNTHRTHNDIASQHGNDDASRHHPSLHTTSSNTTSSPHTGIGNNTPTTTSQRTTYNAQNDAQATSLVRDFPHFIVERKYSNARGRFSSSYRIRHVHSSSVCVVKAITIKILPDESDDNTTESNTGSTKRQKKREYGTLLQSDLLSQERELNELLSKWHHHPNVVPYYAWFLGNEATRSMNGGNVGNGLPFSKRMNSTVASSSQNILPTPPDPNEDQSIYLLRPHIYSTLSQRIHQRPFLDSSEKMFIAFQILRAVADLHEGFYSYDATSVEHGEVDEEKADEDQDLSGHQGERDGRGMILGHLHCDNIGITSWNWVLLLDLFPVGNTACSTSSNHDGGIRPVVIPDDDPSDWIYYFQERSGDSSKSSNASGGPNQSNIVGGGDSGGRMDEASGSGTDEAGGTSRINGGEKRCYLAPERFITSEKSSTQDPATKLTPAMDIFSLGCVLIELFLNGEPAFDLGDLLEYKRHGSIASHSSLPHKLNKIESGSMRAACRHMLHLDPTRRLSAKEYLQRLMYPSPSSSTNLRPDRDGVAVSNSKNASQSPSIPPPIPSCHETVFYPLFVTIRKHVLSPDARIVLAVIYYGRVLRETVGVEDKWGEAYFQKILSMSMIDDDILISKQDDEKENRSLGRYADLNTASKGSQEDENQKCSVGNFPPCPFGFCNPYKTNEEQKSDVLLAETENLLRQIEMSTIFSNDEGEGTPANGTSHEEIKNHSKLPIFASSPYDFTPGVFHETKQTPPAAALTIFVQFILSTIRYAQRPTSKIIGLQLLLQVAKYSSDEVRLQRITPTMVSMLKDIDPSVRSMAITSLAKVLSIIETFPPSDAHVFPKYIFQRVSHLIIDPVLSVRVSFAESIAVLAETAMRFLDTCHVIKLYEATDGGGHDSDGEEEDVIEKAMESVGSAFDDEVTNLLGEASTSVDTKQDSKLKRNLKSGQKAKQEEKNATTLINSDYDRELSELHAIVARWVVSITTDTSDHSSSLKHGLLKDIARLCNFFGHEGVMACILPQVLAFLNHRKDWQLRATLCEYIPSICTIVGRAATEQFVVPCIETALIDEEDMVISSALRCISTLMEMGLLTRAVLLGTVTMNKSDSEILRKNAAMNTENKPNNGREKKPKQGIIQKYSSLLVHPSGDVRQNAAFLYTSCCRCLGYPDDEVFVLPLIRPFMRFDIGRSNLKSCRAFMSCLLPPLTRNEFNSELKKPTWTAVQIGKDDVVSAEPEDTHTLLSHLRLHHSDETLCSQYIEKLEVYLRMFSRNVKSSQPKEEAGAASMRIVRNEIQHIGKSVYSCYVPNQIYAELLSRSLPVWYDEIRQTATSNDSLATEASTLRTMKTLSDVYGLNIVQPTNSNEPQRRWRGDGIFDTIYDSAIPTTEDGKVENATSYLQKPISLSYSAAINGQWAALSLLDPSLAEMSNHVSKLVSLDVPSIPPRLGSLCDEEGRSYTCSGPVASLPKGSSNEDTVPSSNWTPAIDTLACTSSPNEHNGPVTRLTASQDQAYFVSGSHDGTCKIWEMRQVESSAGNLSSSLTYDGHNAMSQVSSSFIRVNDVSIVENSHSVASAGSDGSVHVWRVDMVSRESKKSAKNTSGTIGSSNKCSSFSRVSGSTMLRQIEPNEGEILCVSHFNTPSSSIVTFATQKGVIHSWDLRCSREPFTMPMNPELGHLTSMAVGNDRNWMVAGSNRGFLCLFDIRFSKMVKLYQHESAAPVNRLGTSTAALAHDTEASPYVVMGCGLNETSVFDVARGSCSHCFRVLDSSLSYLDHSTLPSKALTMPTLNEIPIPSALKRRVSSIGIHRMENENLCPPTPSTQCFSGRIGTVGQNYLITGDDTGYLRYWSFSSSSRCFTINPVAQPREVYESVKTARNLMLCRESPRIRLDEISGAKGPKAMQRVRPENGHKDAILDIKKIVYPTKGILTCSRDGTIKFWT